MRDELRKRLYEYLRENNPDVLLSMSNQAAVTDYLNSRLSTVTHLLLREGIPDYIMEAECMDAMTADLRPSKYHYIITLLEEEFISEFLLLQQLGVLRYEAINLIDHCAAVFDELGSDDDDNILRYHIIGAVGEYLGGKRENEIVSNELQPFRETGG